MKFTEEEDMKVSFRMLAILLLMFLMTGCGIMTGNTGTSGGEVAEVEKYPYAMSEYEMCVMKAYAGNVGKMLELAKIYSGGEKLARINNDKAYFWYNKYLEYKKDERVQEYCNFELTKGCQVMVRGTDIYGRECVEAGYFVETNKIVTDAKFVRNHYVKFEVEMRDYTVIDARLISADVKNNMVLLEISGCIDNAYLENSDKKSIVTNYKKCDLVYEKVKALLNNDPVVPAYYEALDAFDQYTPIAKGIAFILGVDFVDTSIIEREDGVFGIDMGVSIPENKIKEFLELTDDYIRKSKPEAVKMENESVLRYYSNDLSYYDLSIDINDAGNVVVCFEVKDISGMEAFIYYKDTEETDNVYENFDIERLIILEGEEDLNAITEMGRRMYLGIDVEQNLAIAEDKLKYAADRNIGDAYYYLALMEFDAMEDYSKLSESIEMKLLAAYNYGREDALNKLAAMAGYVGDNDKSYTYLEMSSEGGNIYATYKLGTYLIDGTFNTVDMVQGEKLLKKAMDAGYKPAMLELAEYYSLSDRNCDENYRMYLAQNELEYLEKCLYHGKYPEYLVPTLGDLYENVFDNPVKLGLLLENRLDYSDYFRIGDMYYEGRGVLKNYEKAESMYKRGLNHKNLEESDRKTYENRIAEMHAEKE